MHVHLSTPMEGSILCFFYVDFEAGRKISLVIYDVCCVMSLNLQELGRTNLIIFEGRRVLLGQTKNLLKNREAGHPKTKWLPEG